MDAFSTGLKAPENAFVSIALAIEAGGFSVRGELAHPEIPKIIEPIKQINSKRPAVDLGLLIRVNI
jgi:hypothetical protein